MKNFIKKIIKKFLNKKKLDNTVEANYYYPAKKKIYNKIIPNNFFQTYKSKSVDTKYDKKIKEFREKNPSFNYYFFDDIDCEEFMEKHWSHRKIYEIYKNSIYGASKADIWRYCVLFTYGGVYLDFDSSINFRLEEIPKDCSEIISFEDNLIETQISKEYTPDYDFLSNLPKDSSIKFPDHIVLQWLLIFKKEHPILERVISEIEKNYDFYVNKTFETIHLASVNFYGPVLLTKVIWDYVLDGNTINQKNIDYDGLAKFKDISSDGVYSNDKGYYKNFYNSKLLFSDQVRLNLGCGEDLKKGFINIDVN